MGKPETLPKGEISHGCISSPSKGGYGNTFFAPNGGFTDFLDSAKKKADPVMGGSTHETASLLSGRGGVVGGVDRLPERPISPSGGQMFRCSCRLPDLPV
jgi:hypothetical protein